MFKMYTTFTEKFGALFFFASSLGGGINCYHCNAFYQGITNTCENPANRSECAACMKVITKIQINDGWLIRRTSSVESKICVVNTVNSALRDEGCYYQENNGGYTQRCYCYSNNCNKASQLQETTFSACKVISLGLSSILWIR